VDQPQPQNDIEDLLQEHKLFTMGQRMLVIGAAGSDGAFAEMHDVIRLDSVGSAGDISEDIRVDVSVVVGQIEHMSKDDGAHLLSCLRDIISQRVLLVLQGDDWASDELLALGYQEIKCRSGDGRYFLFDADQFHQPRKWNNASHWANPKNFGKYRW
jgi:hypothetical protein